MKIKNGGPYKHPLPEREKKRDLIDPHLLDLINTQMLDLITTPLYLYNLVKAKKTSKLSRKNTFKV